MTTLHGDARSLPLDDESIDAIVTDPPYGLEFMGKEWDRLGDIGKTSHAGPTEYDGESVFTRQRIAYSGSSNRKCRACEHWEYSGTPCTCARPDWPNAKAHQGQLQQQWHHAWAVEALRVAKPGAHLLAFGGTRTHHRLMVALEDAGWEIRDCLMWLYGSGFPKSLDVSKAIDRQRDDRPQILQVTQWLNDTFKRQGVPYRAALEAFGFNKGSGQIGHWTALTAGAQPAVPTLEQVPLLLDVLGNPDVPQEIADLIWTLNGRKGQPGENWWKREKVGERSVPIGHAFAGEVYGGDSSAQIVDVNKPATDLARQWEGWGTALKPAYEPIVLARKPLIGTVAQNVQEYGTGGINVDGGRISGEPWKARRDTGLGTVKFFTEGETPEVDKAPHEGGRWPANVLLDEDAAAQLGEPARYFYVAKASRAEREAGLQPTEGRANTHPTVKPIALMRYLCRLITSPGGTILDPFMGSGSTGCAAALEGFDFIGIDQEPEYVALAGARIAHWTSQPAQGALV